MKKGIFIAIALSPMYMIQASNFKALVSFDDVKADLRVRTDVIVISSWRDKGSQYNCSPWTPNESTVDFGTIFKQTNQCDQRQERDTEQYHVYQSGKVIFAGETKENQVIRVDNERDATGIRDYIVSQRTGGWSAWEAASFYYDCDTWTPDPEDIHHGSTYTQTRNCSEEQERERIIYDVWFSGNETENTREGDEQTVSVVDSQIQIGLKDYILGEIEDPWSSWVDKNGHYNCGTWTPPTNTVNLGTTFTQERNCSQDQDRSRDVYDNWKLAGAVYKRTEIESQTISETEFQQATGTKNFITGQSNGAWGNWIDFGSLDECNNWSPDVSTVDFGVTFTQTRDCLQNQKRSRNIYDDWADGTQTVNSIEDEYQVIPAIDSRQATGTKDAIVGTSTGSWSSWTNSGSAYSCGSYSPDPSTVNLNQSFTQTRNCKQNQTRNRTIYDVWSSGRTTVKSTENGSQTVDVSQSRSSTGTKDYITGTSYGSWSGYSDTGSASCGSYSPSTSTVNLGQSFTQTRSCTQPTTRSRSVYNVWASGKTTYKTSQSSGSSRSYSQNRSATGSKDYVTGTSYGSWSTSDTGSASCGSYSPSTSTVNLGQSFTQSRSCTQPTTSSRSVYNVWKSGKTTYKTSESSSGSRNYTQNKNATGSKDYIMNTTSSTSSTSSSLGCTSWSPSASNYYTNQNVNQTRTCTTRTTTTTTYTDNWKSGKKTNRSGGSTYKDTTSNQSQTVKGTKTDSIKSTEWTAWSSFSNTGSPYDCKVTSTGNWEATFYKEQCTQKQVSTRTGTHVWNSGKRTSAGTQTRYNYATVTVRTWTVHHCGTPGTPACH